MSKEYFLYALSLTYSDDDYTDSKLLGFFDCLEDLEEIKDRAVSLPGFRKFPESFVVDKYILDKIHWKDGFTEVVGEIGRDYLERGDETDKNTLSVKELGLKQVFSLSHSYTINTSLDDERIIGKFSSLSNAENAVEKLKEKPGFENFPLNFDISKISLKTLLWSSGFGDEY